MHARGAVFVNRGMEARNVKNVCINRGVVIGGSDYSLQPKFCSFSSLQNFNLFSTVYNVFLASPSYKREISAFMAKDHMMDR